MTGRACVLESRKHILKHISRDSDSGRTCLCVGESKNLLLSESQLDCGMVDFYCMSESESLLTLSLSLSLSHSESELL